MFSLLLKRTSIKILLAVVMVAGSVVTAVHADHISNFVHSAIAASCEVDVVHAASVSSGKVAYEFTVTNMGTDLCQAASLTLHYSDRETVQAVSPKSTAGNYYWQLGNLGSKQSSKVSISTAYAGTDLYTEACATANNGQDDCIVVTGDTGSLAPEVPALPPTDTNPLPPVQSPVQTDGSDKEFGMWVWNSPVEMTAEYRRKMLDFAVANKVNVLYVTVDDYLTLYNLPASANRTNKIKNYNAAVATLLAEAKAKNIAVDAEAGWKDWAETAKRVNGYNIVQYVIDFNAAQPNKFRKLQFDVEPYLLSYYERNKATTLTTYVEFIAEVAKRAKAGNLSLGIVIPHFYDSTQKWTPTIKFNGITDFTYNHLLSILNTVPNSDIIIMSYRNFAEGNDGVIQLSDPEVQQAVGSATKVIVAQETGDVDPAYVTYFGKSKTYMNNQISLVNGYFATYSSFDGIAVNYYEPFAALKN